MDVSTHKDTQDITPGSVAESNGADGRLPEDTLTVTDNRTGRTYDLPFMNTAACRSSITYLDGTNGILEYRGYPIEQLAAQSSYLEVAYLLVYGELPTAAQLEEWQHHI